MARDSTVHLKAARRSSCVLVGVEREITAFAGGTYGASERGYAEESLRSEQARFRDHLKVGVTGAPELVVTVGPARSGHPVVENRVGPAVATTQDSSWGMMFEADLDRKSSWSSTMRAGNGLVGARRAPGRRTGGTARTKVQGRLRKGTCFAAKQHFGGLPRGRL
jgi:hypothetical protein